MSVREALLALTLLTGATLVVRGVALWSVPTAYIVAGLLLAGIGYLFTAEAD